MTRTGVFATEEQVKRIRSAASAPLIALNTGMPPHPQEIAHVAALEQGLPEIEGYYGIDLKTGEFVAASRGGAS